MRKRELEKGFLSPKLGHSNILRKPHRSRVNFDLNNAITPNYMEQLL